MNKREIAAYEALERMYHLANRRIDDLLVQANLSGRMLEILCEAIDMTDDQTDDLRRIALQDLKE